MRGHRGYKQPGRGGQALARVLTAIAILLIAVVCLDLYFRPIVREMIVYEAKLYAMRVVNESMLLEIEESGVAYDDIAHLTHTEDGSVSAIQTDVFAINRLKARSEERIVLELQEPQNQSIQVPLGTLLGNHLTSGRGPKIEIRLIPLGYVETEVYNEFTSAGINQTLHRIVMYTTVEMSAVLPGYNVRTEVQSSYVVAETVIVGAIPEGYTVVGEDGRSAISKINDYKAE